ncbi:hypothetical protein UFOVP647_1, partial [uncultured Caudovirales phage]
YLYSLTKNQLKSDLLGKKNPPIKEDSKLGEFKCLTTLRY